MKTKKNKSKLDIAVAFAELFCALGLGKVPNWILLLRLCAPTWQIASAGAAVVVRLQLQLLTVDKVNKMCESEFVFGNLCPCIYFPLDENCRDCSLAPWQFTLELKLSTLMHSHLIDYPICRQSGKFAAKIKNEVAKKVNDAIWVKITESTPTDESVKKLMNRVMRESYDEIIERRQQVANKYLVPVIEKVIEQHYKPLVEAEVALPFQTLRCRLCEYGDEHYEKMRENIGNYPTKTLRAYLLEMCLFEFDQEYSFANIMPHSYILCRGILHNLFANRDD